MRLIFTNNNATLKHATGNLRLKGASDIHAVANQVVILLFDGTYWYGG